MAMAATVSKCTILLKSLNATFAEHTFRSSACRISRDSFSIHPLTRLSLGNHGARRVHSLLAGENGNVNVPPPDVADLAQRARIQITPDEVSSFSESLGRIVEWFGELQQIDVEGVPPAIRVGEDASEGELSGQPDEPTPFPYREEMLAQVPKLEGEFLKVPRILSEDEA
eukprot:TRINITY_DN12704_c0_g1_i12.p1 TRINITY_DN12704_c0_g1~~TRINITY_DN12704_c0_g1_i12.p1  ORF type:complete len:170 (+),score=31.47 TRINITY_DN12704_c0_g1_i12:249-758(+)